MLNILKGKIDGMECGELLPHHLKMLEKIINGTVKWVHEKGITGTYYLHFWFQTHSDEYIPFLHIRRLRPSPYQMVDHYLWKVEDGGKVTFQWCIPKKEALSYILNNPHKYDVNYIRMLRQYCADKLEKIEDYLVEDKVI